MSKNNIYKKKEFLIKELKIDQKEMQGFTKFLKIHYPRYALGQFEI